MTEVVLCAEFALEVNLGDYDQFTTFCNQLRYGTLMVTALQPVYIRGEICSRNSTIPIIHQHLLFIQMPIKRPTRDWRILRCFLRRLGDILILSKLFPKPYSSRLRRAGNRRPGISTSSWSTIPGISRLTVPAVSDHSFVVAVCSAASGEIICVIALPIDVWFT